MSTGSPFRSFRCSNAGLLTLAVMVMPFVMAEFCAAQIHGIPPSVTSIQYHTPPFMPNVAPSVTSLGPNGYGNGQFPPVWYPFPSGYGYTYGFGHPYSSGYGRGNGFGHRNNNGYSNGTSLVPIYVPAYDGSYGYDPGGEGGPYMSSRPPTDQAGHVIVDLPAAKRPLVEEDEDGPPPPIASRSNRSGDGAGAIEVTPVDPTVLVFRDGHQQEVTNYAIVGQTIYVFDARTQKIAITDLDVAKTIKLNDDRGVDFHVPAPTKG
jgi:hypothetical protein